MSAPPRFTFDPVSMRYRNAASGRFVSSQQVHGWMLDYSDNLGKSMRGLTEQLRAGQMDLRSWQLAMRDAVKAGHLATGMAAKGGRAQMTQADWGRLGNLLRREYQYLGRLADGIADGSIPLDGEVLRRSAQYGKAARETYENIWRRETQRRGADEERNVKTKLESCTARDGRPGCVEETARGWVKIGSGGLSLPGERACWANCGCYIETRNSVTGQVFG
jgi:hypothetical protein